jgi:hypothetical protein
MIDAVKLKVLEAVQKVTASHREKFREHVGPKALELLKDDNLVTRIAEEVYPLLPLPVRLLVKQDAFIELLLKHRAPLMNALSADNNRPIPLMLDPIETEEVKRLRKIIEDGLGQEPWEVTGLETGPDGELLLRLKPKDPAMR